MTNKIITTIEQDREDFDKKFCLIMQTSEECKECKQTHLVRKRLSLFSKTMQERGKMMKNPLIISDEAIVTPDKIKSHLSLSIEHVLESLKEEVEGRKADIEMLPSSTEIDFETLQKMRYDMKKFGEGFNTALSVISTLIDEVIKHVKK